MDFKNKPGGRGESPGEGAGGGDHQGGPGPPGSAGYHVKERLMKLVKKVDGYNV